MIGLWASFILTMAIPVSIILMIAGVARLRGSAPGSWRSIIKDCVIGCAITFAITISCCLLLRLSGFIEMQFCRPSRADFGEVEKQIIEPEELWIETQEGPKLHALIFKPDAEPAGTILHLHGSDANISLTVRNSAWLVEHGYQVVALDYRGFGKSVGKASRVKAIDDAVCALDYLRGSDQFVGQSIVVWGQSMGGQVALQAVARAGVERVAAVVSEATYGSPKWHVKDKLSQMGPLWMVQWAIWLVADDSFAAVNNVDELNEVPLLFVHGEADRVVLPYQSEWLYDEARSNSRKEIWLEPGYGHLKVFSEKSNRKRLVDFFDRAFDN